MQKLQARTKALDGSEIKKTFDIRRSWSIVSGHAIYEHMDGTYAYKDGSPIMKAEDFQVVIHDERQLKKALSWWDRIGKKQSQAFYDALDLRLRALDGDHVDAAGEEDIEKDMILYTRVPAGESAEDQPEPLIPMTWMEIGFTSRPDWWGVAKTIEFNDFMYLLHSDEELVGAEIPDEILAGQKELINMNAEFLNENEVIVRHIDDGLYEELGPLEVIKTTKKYVEAETAYVDESAKIYFTGNKEPNARIPIEDLMLVQVTPVEQEKEPDSDETSDTSEAVTTGEF